VITFQSSFAGDLRDYVEMRKALGYKFDSQATMLRAFDAYACERGIPGPTVSQDVAVDWATSKPGLKRFQYSQRYQIVRHFAEHLALRHPGARALDPKVLSHPKIQPMPYIYSAAELERLLATAAQLSRKNPSKGFTLRTILGLTVSAGLRVREVVRLDRDDVDLDAGVLTVRRTKFNKDRLVPIHASTTSALREYATRRDELLAGTTSPAFFLHLGGGRFATGTVRNHSKLAIRLAGIARPDGTAPRFHDLRHTFAVRRLEGWYREGRDIHGLLPVLATYMGHVHYRHTAYYLTATPTLLALAAERFERGIEQLGGQP